MSYKINKTDGELLVELADGNIDNTSTDITLIGRNYKGFGELFNENFVKMLENFASTAAPGAPLVGQLWYDTSDGRLKLYDGTTFRSAAGTIVSNTQPEMVQGDIWIDNQNNQLYFFDGTDVQLVGPEYTSGQDRTGFEVASVIDISSRERVVLKIFVGGTLFGVIADEEFRVSGDNKVQGYPDDPDDVITPKRQLFEKGFNLVSEDYWFRGTAESARALVDAQGNVRTTANFLPTDDNGETIGSLKIKNSAGLSVGIADAEYVVLKVAGTTTLLETQQSGQDLALRTRVGNQYRPSLYIDSSENKVGIYTDTPGYTLDVNGDIRSTGNTIIDGDLLVKGDTTYFNVSKLAVEDKNIELGLLDDSTEGADADIDGAGVIIRSTDGSKDWTWELSTESWTSNQNIDLLVGNEYTINGALVLSSDTLGPLVTNSSLTNVGTLVNLNVDNISLDSNRITTTSLVDLEIDPDTSIINVNSSTITNLSDPSNNQDAATKYYVDNNIAQEKIVFALDISGLSSPDDDVRAILESLYPATATYNGKRAVIHCTSYASTAVSGIDIQGALNKSFLSVLTDDSSAQSVLQDISFNSGTGTINPAPARSTRTYEIVSGAWAHIGTAVYTP